MKVKFWVVLLLLFVQSFCVVAQAQDGQQLEFLPRGIGRYKKHVNRNTLKIYNTLRPLKKFKVGKKVCIHGTRFWDETCQDAAFAYAFGDSWREIKAASLRFVELYHLGDDKEIAKMCIFPMGRISSVVYHFDGSRGYRFMSIESEERFYLHLDLKVASEYKDFVIGEDVYWIWLSKQVAISFDCQEDEDKNSQTFRQCIKYKPQITYIHIN